MIISNAQECVACPDCGAIQFGPRQIRFRFGKPAHKMLHFSDFHQIDVASVQAPDFLICASCGSVQNFFDCQPSPASDTSKGQRWVVASTDQVLTAIEMQQPPFLDGSGSAHHARLWVWRNERKKIAAGFQLANPERRLRYLSILDDEFCERSVSPVYQYLKLERKRENGSFEEAAQGLRALIDGCEDKHLRWSAQQNLAFCHARTTLQQPLVPPEWTIEPVVITTAVAPKQAIKLVVGVSDAAFTAKISGWINFPSGVFILSDLKHLPTILKTSDPIFSGVIVMVADLAKLWAPGDAQAIANFIRALESTHRAIPWLLVDTDGDSKPWLAALRGARFHVSSIGAGSVEADRFASWLKLGQLRASRETRRLQKAG